MRVLKIVLTTFAIGVLVISLAGCAAKSTPVSESQVATVKRGDLTVDITASGNLALSRTADLAFEMAGTVQEIAVEAGDSVSEGQVLASLDTSEWEDNLAVLENTLAAKKRALPQVKISLMNAETALQDALAQYVWPNEIFTARQRVYAAEADVAEAQAMLQGTKLIYDRNTGEYRYQQALTPYDIKVWTQNLSDAQASLATAQLALDKLLKESTAEVRVAYAQETLRAAQAALDKLLAESPVNANEIAVQKQKVELAQKQLEDAQNALKDVAIKKLQLEIAQGQLEDATKAVADAQKALDEAKSASPVIKAPFAGFVTKVNVKGGDDVLKGTVALQIADPTKFEADILVSEMDIYKVKIGGNATVQVAALSTLNLPAKVTFIAPTATVQSGVVNYQVTVELESLEALTQERQAASQEARQQVQQGELPERLKQAVESGLITKEQAEEMMKRMQQGFSQQQAQVPGAIPVSVQLREGLSVTVTVVTAQKSDVLLVPNQAISRQSGKTVVNVLKDGVTEVRSVTTGISNWQYTEVTDGLSEGEQVVISKTTTTTTSGQGRQPSFFFR